jgi:50S ribosomal protein uL3
MDRQVKGILGVKLGMTQVWENNRVVPVTVVQAGPCVVTQVRTPDKDGYQAVQLAYGAVNPRRVNQPETGHFQKAGVAPRRHLVELRTTDASEYTLGQEVTVEAFEPGEYVDVSGRTKGKGFAGVMKRHGFHGLRASHGVERKHRSPGAIGGWMQASDAAKANGGRLPLARLLEPAISLARVGYPVSKSLAWRLGTDRGAADLREHAPEVEQAFSLSSGQVYLLISVFALPGVFLTFVAGILSDRYGRRKVVVPALFLFGIAGAACAFAPNFGAFLALRFLHLGVGDLELARLLGQLPIERGHVLFIALILLSQQPQEGGDEEEEGDT